MAIKNKKQVANSQQADDNLPPIPATPVDIPASGQSLSVDDIGAQLFGQKPDVNEGVMRAEREQAAAIPQNSATPQGQSMPTDGFMGKQTRERKVAFNPELHEVGPDGKPVLTPQGRFKKKPGAGAAGTRRVNVPGGTAAGPTPINQGGETNKATAAMATDTKTALLATFISDEFLLDEIERQSEIQSLTAVLNHYSPTGVPMHPLAAYAMITGANVAKRFAKPKTQSWWQKMRAKIAAKYAAWKYGANYDATQSDSRGDNERENNASNPASVKPIVPLWSPASNS